jgi:hypothetical protein
MIANHDTRIRVLRFVAGSSVPNPPVLFPEALAVALVTASVTAGLSWAMPAQGGSLGHGKGRRFLMTALWLALAVSINLNYAYLHPRPLSQRERRQIEDNMNALMSEVDDFGPGAVPPYRRPAKPKSHRTKLLAGS